MPLSRHESTATKWVPAALRLHCMVTPYLATVLPGLEGAAASELMVKIAGARMEETPRGKLLFRTPATLDQLLTLRTIDNLYHPLATLEVGPHRTHLAELERRVSRLDIADAALPAEARGRNPVTIHVNASRAGQHTYSRFEAAEAATRGLLANRSGGQPKWQQGSPDRHDVEFRLDVVGAQATLAVRLTGPQFRFRGTDRAFAQAALRPPVAHGLVWLSQPRPDDRFLDPFCGSGTILLERAAYPARAIIGGDLSGEAVAAAKRNLAEAPAVIVEQWDASALPVESGTIDVIVTNLPFGRQVLSPDQIGRLYRAVALQLARVMIPNGRAILLTDQVEPLHAALQAADLTHQTLTTLSLKGLLPAVIEVRRA